MPKKYNMTGNFIFLTVFVFSVPGVWSLGETYRAAVVEYNPVMTGDNAVAQNVEQYIKFIKEAKEKGAQIIVFPEGGLRTGMKSASPIPEPHQNIIPCDNTKFETTETVKSLSRASKENKIYTVVNLMEKRACDKKTDPDCPQRGFYLYNTNAVFDPEGAVIARYAKYNLFDEMFTNKTKQPEISFFDTSFGVRFGTFICFDILFRTPTLQLVEQFGITDFVYPTFWFSELPFLTALQAQRGWAESNNVNLLASGVNFPAWGSGGSGIYNGKWGSLEEAMPETKSSLLMIADVPKIKYHNTCEAKRFSRETSKTQELIKNNFNTYNSTDMREQVYADPEFYLIPDQIHLYDSAVIGSGQRFDQKLCSRNNFCCNFQVSLKRISNKSPELVYRAVVSDGVRKFGKSATGGVQSCGVVICKGPELSNCTSRAKNIPGVYKVSEIYIEGEFLKTNAFQMPSTLTDGEKLEPLPSNKYTFKKEEKDRSVKASLKLVWASTNLNTFAIYGRDFTRDGEPATIPASNSPATKSTAMLIITSVFYVIFRY